MLRTTLIRYELLKGTVRYVLRRNSVRGLSVECARRRQIIRLGNTLPGNNVLFLWSKPSICLRYYSADLPPHTKVNLPALSPTMETGTIVKWEKKEGDKLNEGDLLAEIETDKATMGFETPEEGYLAKILVESGTKEVPVGKLVCIIVESADMIGAFKGFVDTAPAVKPTVEAPPKPAPPPAAAPPSAAPAPPPPGTPTAAPPGERVYVSPLAKRMAADKGIDLASVGPGSGLFGSIIVSDLSKAKPREPAAKAVPKDAAKAAAKAEVPAGASYTDIPVSSMRAVIAKRLLLSKQTIPHYYLRNDMEVDKLLHLRYKFNALLEKEKLKISINDFLIKAAALSCRKVPEANSAWLDKVIRQYNSVDMSIAVATDKGLITPIVFEADKKGIATISREVKVLAARAREGKLQPHEFQGGTFSISNLGMYGITSFSAIINPPQACILAVGGTSVRLVPDSKSERGFRQVHVLTATLSCDHRVVDGAVGAQWLHAFRQYIEDPESMLL